MQQHTASSQRKELGAVCWTPNELQERLVQLQGVRWQV
jgi:hypothetical protein